MCYCPSSMFDLFNTFVVYLSLLLCPILWMSKREVQLMPGVSQPYRNRIDSNNTWFCAILVIGQQVTLGCFLGDCWGRIPDPLTVRLAIEFDELIECMWLCVSLSSWFSAICPEKNLPQQCLFMQNFRIHVGICIFSGSKLNVEYIVNPN